MRMHSGIRIDSIPAAGGGGLIFALGMIGIVWFGLPVLQPLIAGCLVGGLLFAPVFHALGH